MVSLNKLATIGMLVAALSSQGCATLSGPVIGTGKAVKAGVKVEKRVENELENEVIGTSVGTIAGILAAGVYLPFSITWWTFYGMYADGYLISNGLRDYPHDHPFSD